MKCKYLLWILVALLPLPLFADVELNKQGPLVVGVKHSPPFVIKHSDEQWSGISVDLWRHLASELALDYRFEENDLAGLLSGVESGRLDAAVGAITVTADRIQRIGFSHPFFTSGLSIAVQARPSSVWLGVLKGFFTWQFVSVISALLLVLLMVGILVWLFERRRNQQFGGPPINGVGSGLWWSAVTMTTVGYGDKSPVTLGGRLVAMVWMFASIIIISSFTAAITSSLTVGQLATGISGPQDLYKTRTGTVSKSSSETYLQNRDIGYVPFKDIGSGLSALARDEIEAFVYDQPLLQYLAKTDFQGDIEVLPSIFRRQDYAIALPKHSTLGEAIDRQLLLQLESPVWQTQLARYLGLDAEL